MVEKRASLQPFHLAVPVTDLASVRAFYIDVLGCTIGREAPTWVDLNFFGHQITFHERPDVALDAGTNPVDGREVPLPHFGVVLTVADWRALADRLTAAGIDFVIEPTTRFSGQVGEQSTLFFRDPVGNALEFKAFADPSQLFARGD